MNVCPLLFTIDQEKSVLNSFLSVQLLVSVKYMDYKNLLFIHEMFELI